MVRTKSNHLLWLLQHISEYHRPGRLAAAIALGLLAGFVPKANLLAIALYAAIILLPVHSLLGLAVSVVTSCAASFFDPMTNALGNWLLSQELLQPLWATMDNAPVLPWLALHNTVVLGSFVSGIVLLGPVYLISLRFFEHWLFQSPLQHAESPETSIASRPARVESTRTRGQRNLPAVQPAALAASPPQGGNVNSRHSDVPAPKLPLKQSQLTSQPKSIPTQLLETLVKPPPTTAPQPAHAIATSLSSDGDFDPIREVTPIINSWHMSHASMADKSVASVGVSNPPQRTVAMSIENSLHSRYGLTTQTFEKTTKSAEAKSLPDASRPSVPSDQKTDGERLVPPVRPTSDNIDSLQLAQSASDVLAWADDLLDECLAAEGMTLVSADSHSHSSPNHNLNDESPTEFDVIPIAASHDERWLMETTIEIVRWADDPNAMAGAASGVTDSYGTHLEQRDTMLVQPTSNTWSATVANTVAFTGSSPGESVGDSSIAKPTEPARAPTSPQPLAPSDLVTSGSTSPSASAEPVRGECLGFLLGHLRQSRQGKST